MSRRAPAPDDATEPIDVRAPSDDDTVLITPTAESPDTSERGDDRGRRSDTKRRHSLPLGFRLVATFVFLFAAALLVVAGITIRLTRDHLDNELDDRLTATVASFQSGPAQQVTSPGAVPAVARSWLAAEAVPDDQVVAVRTANGEVLTSTGGLDLQRVDRSAELLMARRSRWWDVDSARGPARALTVPIVPNGQPVGTLVAAASRSPIDDTPGALQSSVAWASGIGLAWQRCSHWVRSGGRCDRCRA